MKAYRAALLAAAALVLAIAGAAMPARALAAADDGDSAGAPAPEVRPSLIHALSAADHDLYTKAFQAADRGDWTAARGLADQGRDPVARRLVIWRYLLSRNSGASFAEISAFLKEHPDWPLRHVLFERAEQAMPDTLAPGAVIGWFGDRKPATGIGMVRLGAALIATGQRDKGDALIRKAWIDYAFEPVQELSIIQRYGSVLTPAVDRQRLERLIWRGDLSAARRELSRVGPGTRHLAQVRMALRTNPRAGERMVARLPSALRDNPALLFDRARVLRRTGDSDAVPDLLVKAPTAQMAKINPSRWWGELALAARQSMKDGDYQIAYRLVSDTGLEEGGDFAEAEFMAGWIALRFLHKPAKALAHFRTLAEGVTRPISLARAHYWAGRAYQAQNELAAAARQYRLAAENPETFYGQLALTRLEPDPRLRLKETPARIRPIHSDYEHDDLTRAIRILADLGVERFVRLFAVHDAELHPDAGYISLLASDLVRLGFREVAVRVAKIASYEGIDLLPYSHPVIALPRYRGPGGAPEDALVLGLIRQETEFNADAVSRVGARGIMQLMPRTARQMARLAHLPYRHAELTTSPRYNMQLGMTELSTDLAKWGGSYILAAAAYNAGPANVQRWIATYGDPRKPGVDPIDWIEEIPYSETRNYVQRVIENTQVYRDRLAGRAEPLQILADLYRPNPPPSAHALPASALAPAPPATATPTRSEVPVPVARPAHAELDNAKIAERAPSETAALDPPMAADPPTASVPRPNARPDPVRPARRTAVITPKKRPAH